jgi:hypothetical protein
MSRFFAGVVLAASFVLLTCCWSAAAEEEDSYLTYIKNAKEFKPVKQDPAGWTARWDTWIYMPWRFKWTIGTDDVGGQFCKDHGINGGFTDHGDTKVLPWLEKWNLKFYNDHTAAKGWLHLGDNQALFKDKNREVSACRTGSKGLAHLDAAMLEKLKKIVTDNVNAQKASPMRAAYSLDDEISWVLL